MYNKQAPWGICSCSIGLCLNVHCVPSFCASWLHGFGWLQKHMVTRQTFFFKKTFSWMIYLQYGFEYTTILLYCWNWWYLSVSSPFSCTTKLPTQSTNSFKLKVSCHRWQDAEETCWDRLLQPVLQPSPSLGVKLMWWKVKSRFWVPFALLPSRQPDGRFPILCNDGYQSVSYLKC